MHTPDGLITSWICVAMMIAAIGMIAYSVKKVSLKDVKRMAVFAAVIFSLQMLNFPVLNGTSGHLIGAAFVAILISPYAAVLVMSSVLATQAFVFGDGGMITLGFNIMIMGVVAAFSASYLYDKTKSVMFASWASVVAASFVSAVLLSMSGAPFLEVVPAMVAVHALIGVGEGLATIGLLRLAAKDYNASHYLAGAFAVLALALPFASASPDGFESVTVGYFSNAITYSVWMPDYSLGIVSGLIGMAMVFTLTYALPRIHLRKA